MSNQTIDGVPRKILNSALNGCGWEKTEALRELRALLDAPAVDISNEAQRVINRLESSDPDFNDCADAVHLIRVLSAKQAAAADLDSDGRQAEYNKLHEIISGPGDCHAAARRVYAAGYRKYEPSAQPQGEPVAWSYKVRVHAAGIGLVWRDKVEREAPDTNAVDVKDLTPLYAEQPAPVAVVGTVSSHDGVKCISFDDENWSMLKEGEKIWALRSGREFGGEKLYKEPAK